MLQSRLTTVSKFTVIKNQAKMAIGKVSKKKLAVSKNIKQPALD